jgi:hypothetical protein
VPCTDCPPPQCSALNQVAERSHIDDMDPSKLTGAQRAPAVVQATRVVPTGSAAIVAALPAGTTRSMTATVLAVPAGVAYTVSPDGGSVHCHSALPLAVIRRDSPVRACTREVE